MYSVPKEFSNGGSALDGNNIRYFSYRRRLFPNKLFYLHKKMYIYIS